MAVWDTFLLNDELDLLESRLAVLSDVVDHFVVVEADRTFTGREKPLHLTTNLDRFARWQGKLIPVAVTLDPDGNAWEREHAQERAQREALQHLADDDLLLVGDVDEIPHPHVVAYLKSHLDEPLRLVMRHALYRANWVLSEPWEEGTVAARGSQLDDRMIAQSLGVVPESWEGYRETLLPGAGWHVSYLGGPADLVRKLGAFSHQELNTARDREPRHLERMYRHRVDLTGRRLLEVVGVDDLDATQQALRAIRPDWFDDDGSTPPRWRRRGVRTWTWARRSPRLPDWLVRGLDPVIDRPTAGLPVLAVLAAADRVRESRRRHRPAPVSWKRGRWLEPIADRTTPGQGDEG